MPIIALLAVLAALIVAGCWLRAVTGRERLRCIDSGLTWSPNYLYVSFESPRDEEGSRAPQASPQRLTDGYPARSAKLEALDMAAKCYRVPAIDAEGVGQAMRCDRCRMYDLSGLRRRDRGVLYTLAFQLVEECRSQGRRACASLAGDPSQGVSAFLCHANIQDIAQHPEVFSELVRRSSDDQPWPDAIRRLTTPRKVA